MQYERAPPEFNVALQDLQKSRGKARCLPHGRQHC
jgi:hypothetical protein